MKTDNNSKINHLFAINVSIIALFLLFTILIKEIVTEKIRKDYMNKLTILIEANIEIIKEQAEVIKALQNKLSQNKQEKGA
ncbi:MAG: hypothetical protein J0H68_09435 [Sphingobacteriia bacterium]|nr:hypothetical protein [Sphingobacteriia bacterium]